MRIKLILKVYVYIQTVQKIKHYVPFLWTGLTGLTGLTFFSTTGLQIIFTVT